MIIRTHHSLISKQKMSKSHLGLRPTIESIRKNSLAHQGQSSGMKGKKHQTESKQKISNAVSGINHPNWQGGISFLPYCIKFNKNLKQTIRQKYNNKCFLCNKAATNSQEQLSVHHIDYNKDQGCNGKTFELVPLCRSCHSKTTNHREEYRQIILNKLKDKNDCN